MQNFIQMYQVVQKIPIDALYLKPAMQFHPNVPSGSKDIDRCFIPEASRQHVI
jgi:hypothetical protein